MNLYQEKPKNKEDEYFLKWSYADSPYSVYDEYGFEEVKKLFLERDSLKNNLDEINYRFNLMFNVLKDLDNEGLFSNKIDRNELLLNLEVIPPNYSNTLRAIKLNPKDSKILDTWIKEAGEESDDTTL